MAIVYEYRCDSCAVEWVMLSTRLAIGPKEWDSVKYVCFSCQTFLVVPTSIDRFAWKHWYAKNRAEIEPIEMLKNLAQLIEHRLAVSKGVAPLPFQLEDLTCPTCQSDQLCNVPFGSRPMRCPKCKLYTGQSVPNDYTSIC